MQYILVILFFFPFCQAYAQDKVKLYGTVTDFNGQPIDSVSVRLKDRTFQNVYETITSEDGTFQMYVAKDTYYCLYAIKIADYRKTKLEYWAWNVPVYEDLEINPQYENLEIYGVNVIEPQVTPQETYMIYFRPMSLKKSKEAVLKEKVEVQDFQAAGKVESLLVNDTSAYLDTAPQHISTEELSIKINGTESEILSINKVVEYARGFYFPGYLVQVRKPKQGVSKELAYDKISVFLHSKETGERGRADAFVKRP